MILNSQIIKEYCEYNKDKLSKSTIRTYGSCLIELQKLYDEYKEDKLTERFINDDFYNYLLKWKKLNIITVAAYFNGIKSFVVFLESKGLLEKNEIKIDTNKIDQEIGFYNHIYHGDFLDEDEVNKMKNYWKNTEFKNSPRGIRNQLIIEILSYTGITVNELSKLYISDINLDKWKINISNKLFKHKNREVEIDENIVYYTKEYLERRKDKNTLLIVGFKPQNNYIIFSWPLSIRQIQRVINETADNVGIKKKISPSIFRNTKILNLYNNNVKIKDISKQMGYNMMSRAYQRIGKLAKNRNKKIK